MTTQSSEAPSAKATSVTVTGEWECTECGYMEEGAETRRPAQCPECDAPAESLEFFAYDEDDWEDDMDELALLDAGDGELYENDGVAGDADEEFEDEEDAF